MRKPLHCILTALLMCMPIGLWAQVKPSLQDLFDGKISNGPTSRASSSDTTVIDLADWQTEYSTSLTIKDGKKYKFTNGSLSWTGSEGSLFIISNSSSVTFASDVKVTGGNSTALGTTGFEASPLVLMKGGTVNVEGATITANKVYHATPDSRGIVYYYWYSIEDAFEFDTSTTGNYLNVTSGVIYGSITNESTSTKNGIVLSKGQIQGGIRSYNGLVLSSLVTYFTPYPIIYSTNGGQTDYKYGNYAKTHYIELGKKGVVQLSDGYAVSESSSTPQLRTDSYDSYTSFVVDSLSYANTKRIIVKGATSTNYKLTENDLSKIRVKGLDTDKYKLYLADNTIYIDKADKMTEDDLQSQINAAAGNSSAKSHSVITIPDDGIVLTKVITVPKNAYVTLTGGKLTVSKDFSTDSKYVFYVKSGSCLQLENMTWDSNSMALKTMFWNLGQLVFGEKMGFSNTYYTTKTGYAFVCNRGTFDMYSGNFISDGMTVSDLYTDQNVGTINIYNGEVYGAKGSWIVQWGGFLRGKIEANTLSQYGGFIETGETVKAESMTFAGGDDYMGGGFYATDRACFYSGNVQISKTVTNYAKRLIIGSTIQNPTGPVMQYDMKFAFIPDESGRKNNWINIQQALTFNLSVTSDWENYDFTTDQVVVTSTKSYAITQSDLDHITFENLPTNVKAKLDGTSVENNIVLTKQKPSLIDLFGGDVDPGTEAKPTDVMGDNTDVDVTEPEDIKPDLHVLFGDDTNVAEGTAAKKTLTFLFDGTYGIKVPAKSSVTLKNINLAFSGTRKITTLFSVSGTVIIDVNVYLVNITKYIKRVIYINKGGKVIVRGGVHTIPGIFIINKGGTIIYEDGEVHSSVNAIENTGTITISGGIIGGKSHGIHNTGGGEVTITGGRIYGGGTIEGGTAGGNTSGAGHAIYNDPVSWVYILGGTFDDNSSVWSEGRMTIKGNVNIHDYYICRNTTIYLRSKFTVKRYFYFIDTVDIDCTIPLFVGDGYTLTKTDLSRIIFDLPDGYSLYLDKTNNAIYLKFTTGINDITVDDNATGNDKVYNLAGQRVDGNAKGIVIRNGKKYINR